MYVLEEGGRTAGFFSLVPTQAGEAELDFFFLEPSCIGRGYGRALWDAMLRRAAEIDVSAIRIVADPYAEGFYRHMGAEHAGEEESGCIPGRFLPVLTIKPQCGPEGP